LSSERRARATLKNPSSTLAFFVRLRLLEARDGAEILPVLWEDNFVTLLPGEERSLSFELLHRHLPKTGVLELSGQNVRLESVGFAHRASSAREARRQQADSERAGS